MPYTDFDLDMVRHRFTLTIQTDNLFPHIQARQIPPWLQQTLEKGMPFALVSEKARSEFIIVPVLLSVRDLVHERVTIYSGQRLDGDAAVGLSGECDFILTSTPPLPIVQAPIITLLKQKRTILRASSDSVPRKCSGRSALMRVSTLIFRQSTDVSLQVRHGNS